MKVRSIMYLLRSVKSDAAVQCRTLLASRL